MAVKSGMDYGEIDSLIEFLEQKKVEISTNLEELGDSVPQRIASAYSGEAAESYKGTLIKEATKMNETIDTMIATLKANAAQKQADYQAQDAKMAESVASDSSTGGASR